jgi:soluble lytic murein transglycosylase
MRVPFNGSPQVGVTSMPGGALDAPAMQTNIGANLEQAGQALHRASGATGDVALNMQARANQVKVDDAQNKIIEAAQFLQHDKDNGFQSLKGRYALEKPDGSYFNLPDDYTTQLKSKVTDAMETMGNDAQKEAFQKWSMPYLTAFNGRATAYEAEQYGQYRQSVSQGAISTALNDGELNWNNPEALSDAASRINAHSYELGKLSGANSGVALDMFARKNTSALYKTAALAALDAGNVSYAHGLITQHKDSMTGDDMLSVTGHLKREFDSQLAQQAAMDTVRQFAPNIYASDTERLFNIGVISQESGGKQFDANNNPLTSRAGAIGIAQIMPSTGPEAAKLAGVPWDESRFKNDPQYNKALGLAYFQKQIQTYNGDPAKALAAYNAGPESLDAAIGKAADALKDGKMPANRDMPWLEYLGKETQNYVTNGMTKYYNGGGQGAKPSMTDIANHIDSRTDLSATQKQMAIQSAQQHVTYINADIKQKEEDSVANAVQWLTQNSYDFNSMPLSIKGAIPSDKLALVRNIGASLAKGNMTDDPKAYQAAVTNPQLIAKMGDSEWYNYSLTHFTPETKKQMDVLRAKTINPTSTKNSPDDLDYASINRVFDQKMQEMGVDPTPKGTDKAGMQSIGAKRAAMNTIILDMQRNSGKKLSDAELIKAINQVFLQQVTVPGFFTNSDKPMMSIKPSDVPPIAAQRIRQQLAAEGVADPTDADVLEHFISERAHGRK